MRILLVEDNVALAESIQRGLVAEGMVADHVADGLQGSWLALNNPYDVAILDIMLPGKNGYQILKSMRQADVWTPVLMLTTKDGEYDQADAFDLGTDDYPIKPFHFVVLVARLRALARRGTQARPAELVVGPIRLDPASHQVWHGEEVLDLTAKQFSLLHYFMCNEGVFFPRRKSSATCGERTSRATRISSRSTCVRFGKRSTCPTAASS